MSIVLGKKFFYKFLQFLLDKMPIAWYTGKTRRRIYASTGDDAPIKKPASKEEEPADLELVFSVGVSAGIAPAFRLRLSRTSPARERGFRPFRLLGKTEGRFDLALALGYLDEQRVSVEDCACTLVGDAEGGFNLSASYRTVLLNEGDNLVGNLGVFNLSLGRLVRLVTLFAVEQFDFVSAEGNDFSVVGAESSNLVEHFAFSHV